MTGSVDDRVEAHEGQMLGPEFLVAEDGVGDELGEGELLRWRLSQLGDEHVRPWHHDEPRLGDPVLAEYAPELLVQADKAEGVGQDRVLLEPSDHGLHDLLGPRVRPAWSEALYRKGRRDIAFGAVPKLGVGVLRGFQSLVQAIEVLSLAVGDRLAPLVDLQLQAREGAVLDQFRLAQDHVRADDRAVATRDGQQGRVVVRVDLRVASARIRDREPVLGARA